MILSLQSVLLEIEIYYSNEITNLINLVQEIVNVLTFYITSQKYSPLHYYKNV